MSGCCGKSAPKTPPTVAAGLAKLRKSVARAPEKAAAQVLVSREEAETRMAICRACPHFRLRPVTHCAKCGCALALKTKLKIGKCPIGKW